MAQTTVTPEQTEPSGSPAARPNGRAGKYDYDLVVIGAGSGGQQAAVQGAIIGGRVLMIDKEKIGGECLYAGCVPSKALIRAAEVAALVRRAGDFGLPHLNGHTPAAVQGGQMAAVSQSVQDVVQRVYQHESPPAFHHKGVETAFGEVKFVDPETIALNGRPIRARAFVLSTGSRPAIPPVEGLMAVGFLTNESVFHVQNLPSRLAVIGGGPIGCEMAQAFARLGSQVTVLQSQPHLVPREDADVSEVIERRFREEGIHLVLGVKIEKAQRTADGVKQVIGTTTDGEHFCLDADEILVAVGRAVSVAGLELERAKVTYDARKGIQVDERFRTSNPRVFAVGDCIGGYQFTHMAGYQGRVAARNALVPLLKEKADYRVVPWTTFTEPEIAKVGLGEREARAKYGDSLVVIKWPFDEVDRAQAEREPEGFIKLVLTRKGDILGATIVGPKAGEYLNEISVAMKAKLKINAIARTIHVYPTVALGLQQAAGEFAKQKYQRGTTARLIQNYLRRTG